MKIEYKIKGDDKVYTTEIAVNKSPRINITVDGITMLLLDNIDIESINIDGFNK